MLAIGIFFGKLYKFIKFTNVAYLSAICPISLILIPASISAYTTTIAAIFAVLGIGDLVVYMLSSNAIDKLHEESRKLAGENAQYHNQNILLKSQLDKLNDEISEFKEEREKFGKENEKLLNNNMVLEKSVKNLTAETNGMKKIIQDLSQYNLDLNIKLGRLESMNEKLRETTNLQIELTTQAKKFIAALVTTESNLHDVKDALLAGISKVENITNVLERVTTKISSDRFDEIDIDKNGVISREELIIWCQRAKN